MSVQGRYSFYSLQTLNVHGQIGLYTEKTYAAISWSIQLRRRLT